MSNRTITMTDELYAYLLKAALREPGPLARLRAETAPLAAAGCQISPEQGQFMALLIELTGARRVIEVGTFTGYSSTVMALALPSDGRLVACDVSQEWTSIARRYWREAGVEDRIELRLAPALETLDAMLASGDGGYDFAFIDADKRNYGGYYERCLALLRPGGLIAVDNMLWHGKVADPAIQDEDTVAIRELNRRVRDDQRVTCSLLPVGDGLLLARKR